MSKRSLSEYISGRIFGIKSRTKYCSTSKIEKAKEVLKKCNKLFFVRKYGLCVIESRECMIEFHSKPLASVEFFRIETQIFIILSKCYTSVGLFEWAISILGDLVDITRARLKKEEGKKNGSKKSKSNETVHKGVLCNLYFELGNSMKYCVDVGVMGPAIQDNILICQKRREDLEEIKSLQEKIPKILKHNDNRNMELIMKVKLIDKRNGELKDMNFCKKDVSMYEDAKNFQRNVGKVNITVVGEINQGKTSLVNRTFPGIPKMPACQEKCTSTLVFLRHVDEYNGRRPSNNFFVAERILDSVEERSEFFQWFKDKPGDVNSVNNCVNVEGNKKMVPLKFLSKCLTCRGKKVYNCCQYCVDNCHKTHVTESAVKEGMLKKIFRFVGIKSDDEDKSGSCQCFYSNQNCKTYLKMYDDFLKEKPRVLVRPIIDDDSLSVVKDRTESDHPVFKKVDIYLEDETFKNSIIIDSPGSNDSDDLTDLIESAVSRHNSLITFITEALGTSTRSLKRLAQMVEKNGGKKVPLLIIISKIDYYIDVHCVKEGVLRMNNTAFLNDDEEDAVQELVKKKRIEFEAIFKTRDLKILPVCLKKNDKYNKYFINYLKELNSFLESNGKERFKDGVISCEKLNRKMLNHLKILDASLNSSKQRVLILGKYYEKLEVKINRKKEWEKKRSELVEDLVKKLKVDVREWLMEDKDGIKSVIRKKMLSLRELNLSNQEVINSTFTSVVFHVAMKKERILKDIQKTFKSKLREEKLMEAMRKCFNVDTKVEDDDDKCFNDSDTYELMYYPVYKEVFDVIFPINFYTSIKFKFTDIKLGSSPSEFYNLMIKDWSLEQTARIILGKLQSEFHRMDKIISNSVSTYQNYIHSLENVKSYSKNSKELLNYRIKIMEMKNEIAKDRKEIKLIYIDKFVLVGDSLMTSDEAKDIRGKIIRGEAKCIGEGSFGCVYQVTINGKSYAIKRNLTKIGHKKSSIENLINEIFISFFIMQNVGKQRNIVKFDKVFVKRDSNGEVDEVMVMMKEYEGDFRLIVNNNKFSLLERLKFMKNIIDGLLFLHQIGFVHRDVSIYVREFFFGY